MTSLKLGRFEGSLSQQRRISLAKASGHLGGTAGLSSRLSTSSETLVPLMLRYGGSLDAIYQSMMEQLKTSAFSEQGLLPMTSGAIHWQVPILLVMYSSKVLVQPKSPIFMRRLTSKKMFKLLRSRCRMGGLHECRQSTPCAIYIANLLLSSQVMLFSLF